jgi:streptogramin lyase
MSTPYVAFSLRTSLRRLTTASFLATLLSSSSPAFASTDFVAPPGRSSNPYSIVVGPDKNLWFTETGGEKIGRLTTSGVITQFPIAGAVQLVGIASGSDGNIWFTAQKTGKIGHISTSGTNVTQIALPSGSFPQGITAGADGNPWFVDQKQNGVYTVGKVTVAGKVTEYSTKVNAGVFQAASFTFAGVAAGPDGNLWFTNPQASTNRKIGRITTAGTITFYATLDLPLALAAGPDGNVWAIESSHVAKITPAGVETEYPITNGGSTSIVTGPDGNIWFGEGNFSFAKITPAGSITEFPALSPTFNTLSSVCSGPDGALWFPGSFSGNIGRLSTAGSLTHTYKLSVGSTPDFGALGSDGNVWFSKLLRAASARSRLAALSQAIQRCRTTPRPGQWPRDLTAIFGLWSWPTDRLPKLPRQEQSPNIP